MAGHVVVGLLPQDLTGPQTFKVLPGRIQGGFRGLAAMFDNLSWHEHFDTTRLGATDRHWNILAVSPQLHRWWGKRLWATKYTGMDVNDDGSVAHLPPEST